MDHRIVPNILLPYSQLVWEMEQMQPGVYDIPVTFRFDPNEIHIDQLRQAIEQAKSVHPVFSELDESFFQYTLEVVDGIGYWHVTINRIFADTHGLGLFLKDILDAYQGQPLHPDSYHRYIQSYVEHTHSAQYAEHRQALEAKFQDLSIPVRPTIDFPLEVTDTWQLGVYVIPFAYDQSFSIGDQLHDANELVCLASAIATMDYCQTDVAALTWAYLGRETEEEMYIVGSLHRDVPMQIKRVASPQDYWRQVRQEMRFGIRTSDYPYTLTHPYTDRWNYAMNVIKVDDIFAQLSDFPFSLELVQDKTPQPSFAYAILDIEIHSDQLVFRYSASHYRPESIARFAAMVQHNITWLTA